MEQEKLKILEMIEEKKITAQEGLELMKALEKKEEKVLSEDSDQAKWLRVRVYDQNDKQKVNVNIPISLINVGLKLGSKFNAELDSSLKDINLEEIIIAVKNGAEGKLVEVQDENGDKVEVFVE